jgi:hypothetical protein
MGLKLGPRQRIEWDARRGKKDVKAYSWIPKTIADKCGLKQVDKPSLKKTDVIGKNKKGRAYPIAGSQGIGVNVVLVDFGEKTPKGNPKYKQVRIPAGTSISTVIDRLTGSKALRVQFPGNKFWYGIPGA